jgi:predicted small lipoprotein YifL
MKNCFKYILILAGIFAFASCDKKDNYAPPGT